ncbi:hypothetical protein EDM68_01525 [Candidatus Uhrbacteria bacterium]|nr:MAG: hypothetical protein EDM68_01525 [Candidatus Uhrbacteria bacterium]
MRHFIAFSLVALFAVGCAGYEVGSVEESLTVTYDAGEWPARMIRITSCDAETGVCDVDEPEGCRLTDLSSVRGDLTGHVCDFPVAEGEPLAFNVQLELRIFEVETDSILIWGCDPRPEIRENLGEVHVYRNGVLVEHSLDLYGEYCNYLVGDAR